MDDTVPFPAAETAEADRKPRRRRGGARRHKGVAAAPVAETVAAPVAALRRLGRRPRALR